MVVDVPELRVCKAGLECMATPAWVIDSQTIRMVWVNDAGVKLWRGESREELLARDLIGDAPDVVIQRSRSLFDQVRAGKQIQEDWTFYPKGVATPVILHLSGVRLDDGGLGVLNQALPAADVGAAGVQRALSMFRHSLVISAFVDPQGQLLEQNHAASRIFGQRGSWSQWFVEPQQAADLLAATRAEGSTQADVQVSTHAGERRWHAVTTSSLRDPVTGELGVLVEHRDESKRIDAQRLAEQRGQRITDLAQALDLLEDQRQAILTLSAPVLDVGQQTLAVPLVGRLDAEHGEVLSEGLLAAVSRRGARRVILDLTGVAEVHDDSAAHLGRLVAALRLLGARPILTGIRPQLAQQLLDVDFDFATVETLRSLAAGLQAD